MMKSKLLSNAKCVFEAWNERCRSLLPKSPLIWQQRFKPLDIKRQGFGKDLGAINGICPFFQIFIY